jgi:hypothetical protein
LAEQLTLLYEPTMKELAHAIVPLGGRSEAFSRRTLTSATRPSSAGRFEVRLHVADGLGYTFHLLKIEGATGATPTPTAADARQALSDGSVVPPFNYAPPDT